MTRLLLFPAAWKTLNMHNYIPLATICPGTAIFTPATSSLNTLPTPEVKTNVTTNVTTNTWPQIPTTGNPVGDMRLQRSKYEADRFDLVLGFLFLFPMVFCKPHPNVLHLFTLPTVPDCLYPCAHIKCSSLLWVLFFWPSFLPVDWTLFEFESLSAL